MWQLILILLVVILLKDQVESFVPYAGTRCMSAGEYQKYLTGYPRQTFEVPIKPVAEPKHYFYNKSYSPYTFGGYYMGQDYPHYW